MDRFEFLAIIAEIFEQCKSDDELNVRKEQLIKDIEQQFKMSKLYLKEGIL